MPDPIKPGDGAEGGAADGTAGAGAGAPSGDDPKPITFKSQAELDAIIEARVARAKPKDYDELVALREKVNKAAESEKSELQKAKDAAAQAKADGEAAVAKANAKLIRAEILTQASAQGAVDPDAVIAFLAGSEDIVVDGDEVKGAKQAVKKLLESKPYLVGKAGGAPDKGGGEFPGTDPKTVAERIRALETEAATATDNRVRQAKLAEARDLKMAAALSH